jgi:hypothetical protein
MKHSVTPLVGGQPVAHGIGCPTASHFRPCISCGRPFETYVDQPDTAERTRLAVQAIPFALPEKRDE